MRANLPNTPFFTPKTTTIDPAWFAFLTSLAQWLRWGDYLPEGVESATPGTVFLYRPGGASVTLWIKESGNETAGWVAK